jgi:inhibitor of cysteine peptidase
VANSVWVPAGGSIWFIEATLCVAESTDEQGKDGGLGVRLFSQSCRWTGCVAILFILVTEFLSVPHAQCGETLQVMGAAPKVVTLTTQDDGREVMLPAGSSVIVRLEALPGTGYGWQVTQNGSPSLQLEAPAVFEPKSDVEAGGVEDEIFRFRAQHPGTVNLEFHYRRPWDRQGPAVKTFSVRITIE